MALEVFSQKIDDRLYELLEQQMNSDEQRLFVKSFHLYLEYGNDDKAFVIDFDDVWKWVGFARKSKAKELLLKYFEENIHYKILLHQPGQQNKDDNRGGHNKETIMLTVNTFKKFCMKAATKRADEVCDYYLKMENIMQQYIKEKLEEKNTLMLEMEKIIEEKDNIIENERTQYLVDCYDKQFVVYILKIINIDNNKFIIKIGKTDNIKDRIQALSAYFGCKVACLNVYPCEKSFQLEQEVHNNQLLLSIKYTDIINNKAKSTETYLIKNQSVYKRIKTIIKDNLSKYQSLEHLRLRTIQMEYETFNRFCSSKEDLLELMKVSLVRNLTVEQNSESISSNVIVDEQADNSDIVTSVTDEETNTVSQKTFGPRVQVYDKDDLTKVLFVFEGITEASREIEGASFTQIKFASRNKLEYKGYRWNLLDRNEPNPELPRDIGETVTTQTRNTGYIAMVNLDKTNVEKVFKLQKEAAEHISQHTSAISTAIKYGQKIGGYYWILWENLSKQMQDKYLENNILPKTEVKSRGVSVQKIDPITNNVVETFSSITDAVKKMKMSCKTFKLASVNNNIYNGFKWKIV